MCGRLGFGPHLYFEEEKLMSVDEFSLILFCGTSHELGLNQEICIDIKLSTVIFRLSYIMDID